MPQGLRGDFARLARLRAKVGIVASRDTNVRLANVLGAEAIAQVQLGFREGRDPYGRAWRPLKLRGGKPLLDTGRLRSSFSFRANRGSFRIGTNFIGAAVHQYGATIVPKRAKMLRFRASRRGKPIFAKKAVIPSRQMMPERQLPPIWRDAFKGAATRFLSRIMKA